MARKTKDKIEVEEVEAVTVEVQPSQPVVAEDDGSVVIKGWTVEPAFTNGFLVRRGPNPMRVFQTKDQAENYVKRFSK